MQDPKLEERKNQFQKNLTNILYARQEYKLSLRKKSIDDFILRRREKMQEKKAIQSKLEIDSEKLSLPSEILNKTCESMDEFIAFTLDLIKSNEIDYIMYGLLMIRKHLSLERNPPVTEFVNSQILVELLNCLDKYFSYDSIVYEILWCFTNITAAVSSEEISIFFLTPKALRLFENILYSKKSELIYNLLWLVSHIVTDCQSARDGIINSNFFGLILSMLEEQDADFYVVKYGLWLMANLSKVTPTFAAIETLARCVKISCEYFKGEDIEIVTDCVWSLAGLIDTSYNSILSIVYDSGIVPKLLSLDVYNQKNLLEPPLRILGNLLTTTDELRVEQLIRLGCITFLIKNLKSQYSTIIREALWGLSNIAAGTLSQIKQLIQANAIPLVCSFVRHRSLDIVKEAIWTISNCIAGSDLDTCIALCNLNILDEIIFVLTNITDPLILNVTLDGLKALFNHGESLKHLTAKNPLIVAFNSKGGIDLLEKLQGHRSTEVYQAVNSIMEKYYDTHEVKFEHKNDYL